MFDISTVSKRYFGIKLTATDEEENEHSVSLDVAPAKLKTLGALTAVKKAANEDAVPELMEAVRKLLSNNKTGYKVPVEYVESMNLDQLMEIVNAYFDWLGETKSSNPN